MTTQNRAYLLTPPGGAAIAVVRLVGPDVAAFLRAHFSGTPRRGGCVHGDLSAADERVIDDPVVAMPENGAWAELNLHGGPRVVREALDLVRSAGFGVAESPGSPVPDEAIDGATDIEQEILSHLPLARTERAVRTLLVQRRAWEQWERQWQNDQSAVRPTICEMLEDRSLYWLLHPPRVAIVGPANAGKSTLANQLFAQERSITADLPGTTRDWVGEIADVNGLAVMLVDTPGLRTTGDPIEQAAIDRAGEQISGADLVLLVLDASRPLDPEQSPLLTAYPQAMVAFNKSDQPIGWILRDRGMLETVAASGKGVDALRNAIAGHFGCGPSDAGRPRWWTDRQRRELEKRGRSIVA